RRGRLALGATGLTVFIIVPAWLLARLPYPHPQLANVRVGVADAAAVGQPGHVLPLVSTQQVGVLLPVLPARARMGQPPGHLALFLLAHDRPPPPILRSGPPSPYNTPPPPATAPGPHPMTIPRSECLARLRASVAAGRPIVGGGAGTGLSAK